MALSGAQRKEKMKPNISLDWITQLRQRLKSGSTQENSSNERNEKSPAKQPSAQSSSSQPPGQSKDFIQGKAKSNVASKKGRGSIRS